MCPALSCKSSSEFMPETTQKELVLIEFSDEESKIPQIVCRRDKMQNHGSCCFLLITELLNSMNTPSFI